MNRLSVLFFAVFSLVGIVGCGGGSSGANGDDPFNNDDNATPVVALSLEVLNAQCQSVTTNSFTADETICIRASLTRDGSAANNEVVSFATSAQLGGLSNSTALTNTNGIAEINITNPDQNIGAANVTATFGELNDSQGYEYTALPVVEEVVPQISIGMLRNGEPTNRFQAGQQAQIQALLLDGDNSPITNQIVNFSVSGAGPLLTPGTALTNTNGIAQVNLDSTETDQGAFTIQANVTVNNLPISDALNFEIQAADTIVDEGQTRFGHFNTQGVFVEGVIGSSAEDGQGDVEISAGATVGFSVALVDENDQRILTPTPVSFTSNCVANDQATIDAVVTTINGEASATFEDNNCAGSSGNTDQIVASVVINNTTFTITRQLTIQPEGIGSIAFISASPNEIVLQGTGGQNSQSISTLTFQVNGELGNPLSQQTVNFSLNTSTGGLVIEPTTGLTNSQGQVSTRVSAGSVPTAIRVTAEVETLGGDTIRTQSDLLSVNTGLPDQNSFSIAATTLNPEGGNRDGEEVTITVRLADSFNNPVPNGTTVSFTTEGGTIQPSCITGAAGGVIDPAQPNTGTCSVTWTSSTPRPTDHRTTILATAIGHETLIDSNGNNAYDDEDGGPILDGNDHGFFTSTPTQSGFVDHSEAWRDDNENGIRESNETFIDYNSDGSFNAADGLFNGPQCQSTSGCGTGEAATLHVRRSMVLIMSSSAAYYRVYRGNVQDINNVVFTNDPAISSPNALTVGLDESFDLNLVYYDTENQMLPAGTQLGDIDSQGNVILVLDTVNNTTRSDVSGVPGSAILLETLSNPTPGSSSSREFDFVIQTPSGNQTSVEFRVDFQ